MMRITALTKRSLALLMMGSIALGAVACKKTKPDDTAKLINGMTENGEPAPEAKEEFEAAVKAYEAGDLKKAEKKLENATDIAPDFARGCKNTL